MSGKPFFDTNVLVYAVAAGDWRIEIARTLLAQGGVLSVQVLNEFVVIARRKYQMSWKEIRRALADFGTLCPRIAPIAVKTHEIALRIAEQHGYRFYDSLIIAAALETGCHTLYSEDMQDGQIIDGLTIRNPFPKID
ncbi:MAG: PIN domain-containing protein [Acidobacteriaceae bacterium]|nr:PIN domain-containing protein [Acidobacteriaceae bacterium]MBV9033681.1 PIN domain-containing protein [Acidobacteriaceae bacterium]MBV9306495.1 PIN domain-containing protein [Acidobacteriaceae bacterium]MBV9675590.1 PIN domain-containing protein [Acidobacteriaceae bacterium]